MHALVIDRIKGDTAALAKSAATILGATAYDVRAPVNVEGGGPAVLKVIGELALATSTAASLREAGFDVRIVDVKAPRPRFFVRNFSFAPNGLRVENRQGERVELPYPAVACIVRAHSVQQLATTETTKTKSLSLGRAVMTGGLVMRKTKETTRTIRSTTSDELLFVFPNAGDPLLMTQTQLAYQGLGDAVQASQLANFNFTVDELVRRCPGARFDERLRRLAFQNQMLGRTLSAEAHIEFAVALVAHSLRSSAG